MENPTPHHRPSWDEYFLNIADMVGSRGSCDRGRLGCVIVKDKRIIATGYVGSPAGIAHCDEIGHEMHTVTHADGHQSRHCIRTIHAEQNAICQAAREGISLDGATIYQKMTPCYTCAKMIINAGIKRVVCQKNYHGSGRTADIFAETGVQYKILSTDMETYADMAPTAPQPTETIITQQSGTPAIADPAPAPTAVTIAPIREIQPAAVPADLPVAVTAPKAEPAAPASPAQKPAEKPLSKYAASFTPIGKILKSDIPL